MVGHRQLLARLGLRVDRIERVLRHPDLDRRGIIVGDREKEDAAEGEHGHDRTGHGQLGPSTAVLMDF